MIDLASELTSWLRSPEARELLREIVGSAVRDEVRKLLDEELIDVDQAAELMKMSKAAIRKAAERGSLPCQRVGKRLRFKRAALLASGQASGPRRRR